MVNSAETVQPACVTLPPLSPPPAPALVPSVLDFPPSTHPCVHVVVRVHESVRRTLCLLMFISYFLVTFVLSCLLLCLRSVADKPRNHLHRGAAEGRHRAGGGQRGGQPRHAVPEGQGSQADRRPHPREEGREGEVGRRDESPHYFSLRRLFDECVSSVSPRLLKNQENRWFYHLE